MSTKLNTLNEKRASLAQQIKDHVSEAKKRAGGETKPWSAADESKYTALNAEYDENYSELEREQRLAKLEEHGSQPSYNRLLGKDGGAIGGNGDRQLPSLQNRNQGAMQFLTASNGTQVPVLRPQDSMSSFFGAASSDEQLSFGRAMVAIATGRGDLAPREISNLQSAGGGAGGGYTIPGTMSTRVIDLARNKSCVVQAGAQTIPLEGGDTTFVKVTGDPTAYWRGEGAAITESTATFGAFVMRPKTLACLVGLPVELAEDGRGVVELVENGIAQAMALEIDRVALRGVGSGIEPTGIKFTSGVTATSLGASLEYDELLDALTPIEQANGQATGWVLHPTQNASIRKLKDGSGKYLSDHPAIAPLSRQVSNQQTEGVITVGDFSQVMIGMRTTLTVEQFRAGTSGSHEAMRDLLVYIRCYARLDVLVARPTHFNILTLS